MKIFNKIISKKNIEYVIKEVQSKKELQSFSEKKIKSFLEFHLKRNPSYLKLLIEGLDEKKIKKNKIFSNLIKQIREDSRKIYGVYITKKYNKREEYLENNNFKEILQLHLSTKERCSKYSEIYSEIIKRTCFPNSILDLGCGLNPASIFLFNKKDTQKKHSQNLLCHKKIKYFASDLSEKDVIFLDKLIKKGISLNFFDKESYSFRCDLTDEKNYSKLKIKSDWCLLLKVLDPLEELKENISYELIDAIKSKWIICSFPILTVSRKKMKNPQRNWFEKLLQRKELKFETFIEADELFYIIKKF